MSYYPAAPSEFDDSTAPAPRISGLAIAALVCAGLFCIPGLSLIGVILGLVAIVTMIGRSHLRGRGIAIAAIVLGLAVSIGWGIGGYKLYGITREMITMVRDVPQETLRAGFSGDMPAFRQRLWGPASEVSDADAAAFFAEATSRYGEFVKISPDEQQQIQPKPGDVRLEFRYNAEFTNTTVTAMIEFMIVDEKTQEWVKKITAIEFLDRERGNLRFPKLPKPPTGQPVEKPAPELPGRVEPAKPAQPPVPPSGGAPG